LVCSPWFEFNPPVVGDVPGRAWLSGNDCCEDVDGAAETSNGSEMTP
jgi:hypothetical protein